MSDLSKTALLSHKNCMDGSSCALCFLWAGGKRENVFFANPNHDESDAELKKILDLGFKDILITDCSISLKFAAELDKRTDLNIKLLDHHKTAIPLAEFKWCNIEKDNKRCGSKMLYEFLLKDTHSDDRLDGFFDLVDDHDRWINQYVGGQQLAALHGIYGQQMFIDRFLSGAFEVKPEEKFLLDLEAKKLQELIADKKKQVKIIVKKINGKDCRVGFVSGDAKKYTPKLSEALYADEHLNLDVVVCVGAEAISLRSDRRREVDVSAIAKHWRGGGHQAASGYPLSSVLGVSLLDYVIKDFELESL